MQVDPDSVRAEEWINAFDYQYDPSLRNDSFAITSDIFRHPLESGMHMARIAFQAPEMDYDATPVNVTLVLDASGSMDTGNRVAIAREAAESIRRSLRSHDRIAVVHFSTDVLSQYTVDHRPSDDPAVARSISQLDPHSSTNVQAGLNRGVQLADQARRADPSAYNYIILMSDGVANVDATDPFAILESAGDYDSTNPCVSSPSASASRTTTTTCWSSLPSTATAGTATSATPIKPAPPSPARTGSPCLCPSPTRPAPK